MEFRKDLPVAGLKSLRENPAPKPKNSGRPRGALQIPPLRYAPVGMTKGGLVSWSKVRLGWKVPLCPSDLSGANGSDAPPLSSRPERTRISCHAALDTSTCAPFRKGKAHEVHQRHQVLQEIRGSVVEGSAVRPSDSPNSAVLTQTLLPLRFFPSEFPADFAWQGLKP